MKGPKRALVTGASSGIGRATAVRLVEGGWEVWGTSRDPARLPVVAGFHPARLDVGEVSDLPGALEGLWRESGGFGLVVNNAGCGLFGPLAGGECEGRGEAF